jgi:hypothetical protein
MQEIAESTVKAINARTRAVLTEGRKTPSQEPAAGSRNKDSGADSRTARRNPVSVGRQGTGNVTNVVAIHANTCSRSIEKEEIERKGGNLRAYETAKSNLESQRAPMDSDLKFAIS